MRIRLVVMFVVPAILLGLACNKEPEGVPRPPGQATSKSDSAGSNSTSTAVGLPPGHPPIAPPRESTASSQPAKGPMAMPTIDTSDVVMTGDRAELDGVSFVVPEGWLREEIEQGGMFSSSSKVQFRLSGSDNVGEDVIVAITHFPGMRGMDEANLDRWFGQFQQPDGRPTKEVSLRSDFEAGGTAITVVDIPGVMSGGGAMSGGGGGEDKPGYRMLAAIVNHAKGPHFFKMTGPAESVDRWQRSALAFLKSVKTIP